MKREFKYYIELNFLITKKMKGNPIDGKNREIKLHLREEKGNISK